MYPGGTLRNFWKDIRKLTKYIPADLAVFIVSRICRGLAYAHRKKDRDGRPLGIVHRDVNPKNIMIGQEGDVKLTDFGIAKALDLMYNQEGEVIAGKDEYLSPEQARCEVTDHRADLFCCGIVMAELMLGYNIFEEMDSEKTIRNILEMDIPKFSEVRPDVDERLNNILHQASNAPENQGTKRLILCSPSWKVLFMERAMVRPTKSSLPMPAICLGKMGKMPLRAGIGEKLPHCGLSPACHGHSVSGTKAGTEADPEPCSGSTTRQSLKILQVPAMELRLRNS